MQSVVPIWVHILHIESLLAVEWDKVRDKWLLLYIMTWFSGNMWCVLTVKPWMDSLLEVGGALFLFIVPVDFHWILFKWSHLKQYIFYKGISYWHSYKPSDLHIGTQPATSCRYEGFPADMKLFRLIWRFSGRYEGIQVDMKVFRLIWRSSGWYEGHQADMKVVMLIWVPIWNYTHNISYSMYLSLIILLHNINIRIIMDMILYIYLHVYLIIVLHNINT